MQEIPMRRGGDAGARGAGSACRRDPGVVGLLRDVLGGLLLGLAVASPMTAGEVVLRVDGLACPFCAFGIEKKLEALPTVAGIEVQMDEGKVTLELEEGARLDFAALEGAVADAGFTLRKVLIEDVVGTLSRDEAGELLLRSTEPPATFRLQLPQEDAWSGARPGATVAVSGTVEQYAPEPVPLRVSALRPIDPASEATP